MLQKISAKGNEKIHSAHHHSTRQRNNPLPDIALTQNHHNMNYQLWADNAKTKLSKLPDNELWKLAYSPEPDAAKIANDILLERTNQNRFVKKFYVDSVELLPTREHR